MASPISSMASSHDMRFHLPPVSFIGYLRRRVPIPCSRTEAPFAQCEPRFSGESKSGSWPVHTPFWTSAITPQPTEQWVQMLRRISVAMPARGPWPAAALALRIIVGGSIVATAAPPMVRPERRRKVRRPIASRGAATWTEPSGRLLFRMSFIVVPPCCAVRIGRADSTARCDPSCGSPGDSGTASKAGAMAGSPVLAAAVPAAAATVTAPPVAAARFRNSRLPCGSELVVFMPASSS